MKEKIQWIDALKVSTMFLVIIGHCGYYNILSPYGGVDYYNTSELTIIGKLIGILISYIYTFHMPLFMAISGMLFRLTQKPDREISTLVQKKFKRLVIPFLCVSFFYSIPIKYISGYWTESECIVKDVLCGQMLLLGNSHLWYVLSLFWIFIFAFVLLKFKLLNKKPIWLVLCICSVVGLYLEGHMNILGLAAAFKHLLFFCLGYALFPYVPKRKNMLTGGVIIIISIVLYLSLRYIKTDVMLINKLLPYCMFIPLAVLGGSGFCLFIKGLSNKITHIPGYNILNKRTYELYLYSDPINYILIFLFYKFYGEDFLFETNHVLIAVTLRLVITTVGALIVTYMIEHIKEKFAKYE